MDTGRSLPKAITGKIEGEIELIKVAREANIHLHDIHKTSRQVIEIVSVFKVLRHSEC